VVTELNGGDCRVKIGDAGEIRALPVSISSVGAKTTLSLRPERVRINPTNGACANQFDAQVEELIYLGDHTRARVQLLGHSNFVIKVPNSEGVPDIRPGATIRIGWRPEDCRALDAF
jgi:putative spermidine/putrescine transport system ATP-binding protein